MRVEYNETAENNKIARKKNKKKIGPHFFIFLLMIIVSVLISLSLTIWFNVTGFKVAGNSVYSDDDIISVMGIDEGDNLWRVPIKTVEDNIEQLLPYVGTAKVSRKLPGTVTVKITPATEYAYIDTESGGIIVDNNFKVLKTAAENSEGILNIKGAEFADTVIGQKLNFTDIKQRDVVKEVSALLSDYGFTDSSANNITLLDITDELDLKFVIDDRLYVVLGSLNNVENKLTHLKAMLGQVDLDASAKIDISDWSKDNKKASLTYEDITKYK